MKIEFQSAIGSSDCCVQFGQSHRVLPCVHPPIGRTPSTAPLRSPPQVATHLLDASDTPFVHRAHHILALPSLTRAPPLLGELLPPRHRVTSQATPSRAPPRHPLPRRNLSCPSRAPVGPHCSLRRELHLAGVCRDHRRRGQTSLVHLWP